MQLKGIGHAILFLVLLPSHLIGQWHSAIYVGKTFNHDSDIRLFQSPGTNGTLTLSLVTRITQ